VKNCVNAFRPLVATLAGVALLGTGWSYTFNKNPNTNLPYKWAAGTLPIKIMLGTTPTYPDGTNPNTAAEAAAAIWNARMGSLQFSVTFGTGTASGDNKLHELVFASDVFGQPFEKDVLAITTGSTTLGNEKVSEGGGDLIFNTAITWSSYRGSRSGDAVDLRRVVLHELGHLLGLNHPDEDGQNLAAIMNSHISALDTLATDDIDGVQQLYGPPGVPANNNFTNAANVDLNAGLLTVNGFNTNATKEGGEPNHADNKGGRSVWWRWKPGGSGNVTIDTKGSVFDSTLAVYTGSAVGSLTPIVSNDDIESGVRQNSTVTLNVTGGTTYSIAVDGFNNDDSSGADNGGIKLNFDFNNAAGTPPTITTQPTPVTVNVGGSASFSVTATGTAPLSYQWLFNGAVISGATNSSFSLTNVTAANGGTYSVTVTNAAGSVTSNAVALTVNTPPPPPPPPSSGGGGGGAPSVWFAGLLGALALSRLFARRS